MTPLANAARPAASPPGVRREIAAASLLSGAAGFADAVGYFATSVFAANMTGNTVLAAISLTQGHVALAAERYATLLAFFLGAMAARALLKRQTFGLSNALLLEVLILLAASWPGIAPALQVQAVAVAMGVQAAALTRFAGAPLSTVVITSTLARLAETAVELLRARSTATPPAPPPNATALAGTWLSYGVGASLAVAFGAASSPSGQVLLIPALLVGGVAFLTRVSGVPQGTGRAPKLLS